MKKQRLQIKLKEISNDGEEFSYTHESGELTTILNDLVQENPYQISFSVRPIGNVYEVKGRLKTELTRQCSKCGWDIQIPIRSQISEILLPKSESERGDLAGRGGPVAESNETAVIYVEGGVLDAAEMLHEIVALQDPLYPDCGDDDCEHLKEAQKQLNQLEKDSEISVHPFDALKKFKN